MVRNDKINIFQKPPDFLCIGGQKSGTTWLYKNLNLISHFEMPPHKEIHYFNNINTKGLRIKDLNKYKTYLLLKNRFKYQCMQHSLKKIRWDIKYLFGKRTDNWYLSLFERQPDKYSGDISPAYSTLDEHTVRHIKKILPEVKVFFILRNPIYRAWSHFKMDFTKFYHKKIEDLAYEDIISHFESNASILRTDYIRTIKIWERYYPPKQFLICFFDDLESRPEFFLKQILSFIGVEFETKCINSFIIKEPINKSVTAELPISLHKYLAKKYEPLIKELSYRFGSKIKNWIEF